MKSSKFYTEERASVLESMESLVSVAELEERELTEDEAVSFDEKNLLAEELKNKAERALKMEEMKKKEVRNVVSEEEKVKRSYSFLKHIDGIVNNNLDGAEKEMQEQAVSEARANGNSINGADPKHILTVPTGSPMILRGSHWEGQNKQGLLHRSPPIEGSGETRFVVVIDPIYELDTGPF